MKKVAQSYQQTYGSAYGILVMSALLYFFVVGTIWLLVPLIKFGIFNYWPLLMMAVYGAQLFLRNKIVNVVLGIFGLFFSVLQLLNSAKYYQEFSAYRDLLSIIIVVFVLALIMSGILLFGFLQAFKQDQNR